MINQYRTEAIQRRISFTWEVNLRSTVHEHGRSPGCRLQFLCFVRKGLCLFPFYSCILFSLTSSLGTQAGDCSVLCNLPALIYTGLPPATSSIHHRNSKKLRRPLLWGDFTFESRWPTESNRWSESSSVTPMTQGTERSHQIPCEFAYCRISWAQSGWHTVSVTSCFHSFWRQTHSYDAN